MSRSKYLDVEFASKNALDDMRLLLNILIIILFYAIFIFNNFIATSEVVIITIAIIAKDFRVIGSFLKYE